MLTGKQLGAAIRSAIESKGVSKAEVAAYFDVKPPSIQDWMNRGTISKEKLPKLWSYFGDVVGMEHWGLEPGTPTLTASPTRAVDRRAPPADPEAYRAAVDRAGRMLAATLKDDAQRMALIALMTALLDPPQAINTIELSQANKWCFGPEALKPSEIEIPGFVSKNLPTQLETIGAVRFNEGDGNGDRDGETNLLGEREGGQRRPKAGGGKA